MDTVFKSFSQMFGDDGSTMMVSAFVFLSAAALAFGIMAVVQVRLAVKRRAAEIGTAGSAQPTDDPRSLRYASKVATQRLIEYTAKHYSGEKAGDVKELRRRLIQAGFLDQRAPAFFFLARAVSAITLATVSALWVAICGKICGRAASSLRAHAR